jgi:hypothetical protein
MNDMARGIIDLTPHGYTLLGVSPTSIWLGAAQATRQ